MSETWTGSRPDNTSSDVLQVLFSKLTCWTLNEFTAETWKFQRFFSILMLNFDRPLCWDRSIGLIRLHGRFCCRRFCAHAHVRPHARHQIPGGSELKPWNGCKGRQADSFRRFVLNARRCTSYPRRTQSPRGRGAVSLRWDLTAVRACIWIDRPT
jgi:hypothetical protein